MSPRPWYAKSGRPKSWTDEVQDQLAELWCLHGLPFEEIATRLGRTPSAVHQQIRLLGLRLTPQAVAARKDRGIYRGPRKRKIK